MSVDLQFLVTKMPRLNLLGRSAIKSLGISVDNLLYPSEELKFVTTNAKPDAHLHESCIKLCNEFPDLFKPELGCLKDYELEVQFAKDTPPIFRKPRPVPFALQEDVNRAYDVGIAKGIWTPVKFNEWGTPVVPVRKSPLPGESKGKIRVCGDYSATINPLLAAHRHPLPLPEDLLRKLRGAIALRKLISRTLIIRYAWGQRAGSDWQLVLTEEYFCRTFCHSASSPLLAIFNL